MQICFLKKSELCASEQGQPQAPNSLIYPQNWHTTGRAHVPSHPTPPPQGGGTISMLVRALATGEAASICRGLDPAVPSNPLTLWDTNHQEPDLGPRPLASPQRLLVTTDQRQLQTRAPGSGQGLVLAGPRYTMLCSTLREAWDMRPSSLPLVLPQRQRVLQDPVALSGWETQ